VGGLAIAGCFAAAGAGCSEGDTSARTGGHAGAEQGGDAGSGAGEAGAGGAASCSCGAGCEGLDEPACDEASQCLARYGEPAPAEIDDVPTYAGCAARCVGLECDGYPDSEVCAHPITDPGDCWTLSSPPVPDGWVILSVVEPCYAFSQCSE
jgi:hypothetical protein